MSWPRLGRVLACVLAASWPRLGRVVAFADDIILLRRQLLAVITDPADEFALQTLGVLDTEVTLSFISICSSSLRC